MSTRDPTVAAALRALADVCEQHDISFFYTRNDDGVHVRVCGRVAHQDSFSESGSEFADRVREALP